MRVDEKYIELKGQKIWTKYISPPQDSNEPVIVMLHDALGSIEQWRQFAEKIYERTGLPVFLYDRIGHGKSDPKIQTMGRNFFDREALFILPSVLHEFKIESPILYGHSDGGSIALIYASQVRSTALILEAAHIMVEEITRKGVLETSGEREEIVGKMEKYHGPKAIKLFDDWASLWSGELMKDWNIDYLLDRIDVSTLIIQGDQDNYGSEEQASKIEKGINGSGEVLMLKDCGHFPHKEYPDLLLNKLTEFLNNFNLYT